MCGITGYVGRTNDEARVRSVVLDGLERLEYRGYDSAGAAFGTSGGVAICKCRGRVAALRERLPEKLCCRIGIGHTRWATHGEPSDVNSHPHRSGGGRITLVHNGIIENYRELGGELAAKGVRFESDTDSEVAADIIEEEYSGDLLRAVCSAAGRLRGSYALAVMAEGDEGELVAARRESPLIIGVGEGEMFVASDVAAILPYTDRVIYLENDEAARITAGGAEIYSTASGTPERVERPAVRIEWDAQSAGKDGWAHYMLKEINEQPRSIRDTITRYWDERNDLALGLKSLDREALTGFSRVYFVACGTAYHAGCMGRYAFEHIAGIPAQAEIASEFRYNSPFVDERTLVVLISQSGETADTLAVLRDAKRRGARTVAVTNVTGSSIAREADETLQIMAGPEIAVASTKAYTSMVCALYMMALAAARQLGRMDGTELFARLASLYAAADAAGAILADETQIEKAAGYIQSRNELFYLGRGVDRITAMEGALKLKEISYIYTEAFAAGELKHGTIALIEPGTPVIALMTDPALAEKTASNLREVKARGAYVIVIAARDVDTEGLADIRIDAGEARGVPAAMLSIIPAQLIAYHTSVLRGNDVDKPRNLAKSVTVE